MDVSNSQDIIPEPEPGVRAAMILLIITGIYLFFHFSSYHIVGRLIPLAVALVGFWLTYARYRWRGWLARWKGLVS